MRFLIKLILLPMFLSGCAFFDTAQVPVPAPAVVAPVVIEAPSPDAHQARYAYVAEGNGRLFQCTLAQDNRLVNCSATGLTQQNSSPGWLPDSVEFHTINGVKYAYIASNSGIFICNVNPSNGLSNCHTTGIDTNQRWMEWLPTDLKINSESQVSYAYITGVKSIYQCRISGDGSLNKCVATGSNQINKPMTWVTNGIAFHQVNGRKYAYVAGSRRLYQCEVAGDGGLLNCHQTGSDIQLKKIHWHPSNINFSRQGNDYFAYVADPTQMYQCRVDVNGGIINCNATAQEQNTLHWMPNDIVFNVVGTRKYAYVTGVYNVFLCNVENNGALSGCATTGATSSGATLQWNPNNITLSGE